ncbi:Uncharacterised protein [Vibrio cholerae]|nr:Uncharacterised protein [Vibrio cholerae]
MRSSLYFRMSSPLKITSPPVMNAGGLCRRISEKATVDLPQPDSPARPNTSPGAKSKLTLLQARTSPASVM